MVGGAEEARPPRPVQLTSGIKGRAPSGSLVGLGGLGSLVKWARVGYDMHGARRHRLELELQQLHAGDDLHPKPAPILGRFLNLDAARDLDLKTPYRKYPPRQPSQPTYRTDRREGG